MKLVSMIFLTTMMLGWHCAFAATQSQLKKIQADQVCASHDNLFVAPCRTIRARLELGADNIIVRIFPHGTKRIIGYAGKALRCNWPEKLEKTLNRTPVIEAKVTIRPVTVSKPGYMQFACIADVRDMRPK